MLSVFVPVILACQAEVNDPTQDCRIYFGGTFATEGQCMSDLKFKGLPFMEQVLPEGGTVVDVTCLEMEASEGSNL